MKNADADGRSPQSPEGVFGSLARAQSRFIAQLSAVLKPHGVSEPQYNVLRILRGAGAAGLPCRAIAGRMATRLPDITRLLDRLERSGFIARARETRDRRVVTATITKAGLDVLARLDRSVDALHARQFRGMSEGERTRLVQLLEMVAQPEDTSSEGEPT
jgi:DNA-binding MarR family transcriptional regulator